MRHFLWLWADIFLIKPAFLAFSLPLCGFYYSLGLILFLVKLAFHAFSLPSIIHLAIHRQTLFYLLAGLAFSASGFTLLCFTVSTFPVFSLCGIAFVAAPAPPSDSLPSSHAASLFPPSSLSEYLTAFPSLSHAASLSSSSSASLS